MTNARVLPFVDTERLVLLHLRDALAAPYKAVTDLPTPLDPALPLVQVIRSTGSAPDQTTARDRIDVYCMASTRGAMWALTGATVAAMRSLSGAEVDGQLIDLVITVMAPSYLAWSATVHRSIAVYEVQYRPLAATT